MSDDSPKPSRLSHDITASRFSRPPQNGTPKKLTIHVTPRSDDLYATVLRRSASSASATSTTATSMYHESTPSTTDDGLFAAESTPTSPTARARWQFATNAILDRCAATSSGSLAQMRTLNPLTWTADGRYLVGYLPTSLFTFGYLYLLRGTVFTKLRVAVMIAVYTALTCVYATGVCAQGCYDSLVPHAGCSSLLGDGVCFMQFDVTTGLLLTTLGAFVVSIFLSLTLDRWMLIRQAISALISASNNLVMMSSVYMKQPEIAVLINRHAIAAQALVYYQAMGRPEGMSDLVQQGLLTAHDRRKLLRSEFPSKYVLVLQWCSALVLKAYGNGTLAGNGWTINLLQSTINDMRGSAARIFTIVNTQVPYAYVHIVTVVCKVHVLLVALWSGTIVGDGIQSGSVSSIAVGIMVCIVNTGIFEGLLEVHTQLYQPFGPHLWQFPTDEYVSQTRATGRALLHHLKVT